MALGTVTKYNSLEKTLFDTAERQWNDATAGNIMFCLCGNGYTPAATHDNTADLLDLIATGDGAPMVATGLAIDNTTTPGTTYYDSADANFGAAVTILAKYLIAVQPVTAGTFDAATSKLLFYVDLDTTSGTAEVSSTASDFVVYAPTNGWFKTV
ncbi:MAG: hypothetical protein WC856_13625 [Methylococcaceae bacterium]|jgi:hypothetical protein